MKKGDKVDVKVRLTKNKKIRPESLHILENNEYVTIKVSEVIAWKKEYRHRTAGAFETGSYRYPVVIYYYCCSVVKNKMIYYILKHDMEKCTWHFD